MWTGTRKQTVTELREMGFGAAEAGAAIELASVHSYVFVDIGAGQCLVQHTDPGVFAIVDSPLKTQEA
jgi:hypothetical protein